MSYISILKKNTRIKGFILIISAIFVLMPLGVNSIRVYHLSKECHELMEEKQSLEKEKDNLSLEVNNLSSKEYKIRYARENYVFSKEGEDVIKLPSNQQTDKN